MHNILVFNLGDRPFTALFILVSVILALTLLANGIAAIMNRIAKAQIRRAEKKVGLR